MSSRLQDMVDLLKSRLEPASPGAYPTEVLAQTWGVDFPKLPAVSATSQAALVACCPEGLVKQSFSGSEPKQGYGPVGGVVEGCS